MGTAGSTETTGAQGSGPSACGRAGGRTCGAARGNVSLNKQWLPACPPRRWAWEGTRQLRETQSVQRNSRWASEEVGQPERRAHVLRIQGGRQGQKHPSAGKLTGEAEVRPGSYASRPRVGPGTCICRWDQNMEEQRPPPLCSWCPWTTRPRGSPDGAGEPRSVVRGPTPVSTRTGHGPVATSVLPGKERGAEAPGRSPSPRALGTMPSLPSMGSGQHAVPSLRWPGTVLTTPRLLPCLSGFRGRNLILGHAQPSREQGHCFGTAAHKLQTTGSATLPKRQQQDSPGQLCPAVREGALTTPRQR